MKHIKLFEDFDFNDEDWDIEDEEYEPKYMLI